MTTTTVPTPSHRTDQQPAPAHAADVAPDRARRLLWHGAMLFLLGLLTGFAIPLTANPRMALSSHLEGVMNGSFLLLLGLVWPRLTLSQRTQRILVGLALYGTYANWAATLLAAAWGTGRSTPLASAGHSGAPWQEAIVDFGLFSLSFAMITVLILVLRGLRRAGGDLYSRG